MSDPNISDFYGRIARIERARAKGYGHEADGTLGRSHYYRPSRRRRAILGPVLALAACAFALKGTILFHIGPKNYETRVEQLLAGEGFDRLGGWLMQADPVTVFVADRIRFVIERLA